MTVPRKPCDYSKSTRPDLLLSNKRSDENYLSPTLLSPHWSLETIWVQGSCSALHCSRRCQVRYRAATETKPNQARSVSIRGFLILPLSLPGTRKSLGLSLTAPAQAWCHCECHTWHDLIANSGVSDTVSLGTICLSTFRTDQKPSAAKTQRKCLSTW